MGAGKTTIKRMPSALAFREKSWENRKTPPINTQLPFARYLLRFLPISRRDLGLFRVFGILAEESKSSPLRSSARIQLRDRHALFSFFPTSAASRRLRWYNLNIVAFGNSAAGVAGSKTTPLRLQLLLLRTWFVELPF